MTTSRIADDDDDWVDAKTLRRVQGVVRNRRARLDELEHRQRRPQPDRWTGWVTDAEVLSVRAELDYWWRLLREVKR